MTATRDELKALIDDYLCSANAAVQALKAEFGHEDLMFAAHDQRIPRRGRTKSLGGGTFSFHGVGCRIHTRQTKVDFDFDTQWHVSGFDPYRLYEFANNKRHQYSWLPKKEEFISLISELKSKGWLREVDPGIRSNLFTIA